MSFLEVKSELHLQNKLFHDFFNLTFKMALFYPASYGSRANTMCCLQVKCSFSYCSFFRRGVFQYFHKASKTCNLTQSYRLFFLLNCLTHPYSKTEMFLLGSQHNFGKSADVYFNNRRVSPSALEICGSFYYNFFKLLSVK